MKFQEAGLFIRLLYIFIPLFYIACSNPSLAGGGSGTEVSAILGKAVDQEGQSLDKALVRLRPASFISDSMRSDSYLATHSILDTLTGPDGSFAFTNVFNDDYTVEVLYKDTLGSIEQARIEQSTPRDTLPLITVSPLAMIYGNVNINYNTNTSIVIQVYGTDQSAVADSKGAFLLKTPGGSHTLHIAAYSNEDTTHRSEFDGIDLSLNVLPGENRDAGEFHLRPQPPAPCEDGACDSATVGMILDKSGNNTVSFASVITTNTDGRIVELNLHGIKLSIGVAEDIVKLAKLKSLDIGNTGLQFMFPNIGMMSDLEVIKVNDNMMASFPSTTIGNLEKLRELDLSNNELIELPQSLVNCHNLSSINVSGNRLCSMDSAISAWLDSTVADWRNNQRCQ